MRYILALLALTLLVGCENSPEWTYTKDGSKARMIEFNDHAYIIFDIKNVSNQHVVHDPDCVTCKKRMQQALNDNAADIKNALPKPEKTAEKK